MNASSPSGPLLAPDPATDHILGPPSAAVTVVEFGDFECPSCRQAHPAVQLMLQHFGHRVRFVFRHFPLREVHAHAELAAEAAEAAGAQGRFWPYFDLLFNHQNQLDPSHLGRYAEQLGLDMSRFENELKDGVYRQRVQEQIEIGNRLRVRATPTFYVNGNFTDVSFGLQQLRDTIERLLDGAASG
ncbi:DsbA family protein [Variovorax gossypii]